MIAFRNLLSSLLLVSLSSTVAVADDRSPADLLGPATVLYAELAKPSQLLEVLQQHPLRKRIDRLDGVKKAYESKQFLQFKAGVAIVEAKLGKTWQSIIKSVTHDGIAIGFDAETQGLALLMKAENDAAAPELLDAIIELARAAAEDAGNSAPVASGEYRGITAYQLDKVRVATAGRWLFMTNKPETGKAVLDAYLDKPNDRLAQNPQFQAARSNADRNATAWGFVNVSALRDAGAAKDLFAERTENPVVELLLGGLLDTLRQTPYATASLTLDQQTTRLELATPHKQAWTTEAREYYFGPDGSGRAPAPLDVANRLMSVSTYRDVSAMWLQAGDLFTEKMVDQLAKSESVLATLFSGKDFGEEILGEVHPDVQLVSVRQNYKDGEPQPAIKIPAFAAIFRLKDPETVQPEFRRTFQSLIGFLNITGSMNGQPQLDLDVDKQDDYQVISATYLVDKDASPSGLKIQYNFSPSIAFAADYFVVSSTSDLAHEVAKSVRTAKLKNTDANTLATVDVSAVSDALNDNRTQLVAQNMLSEGHSKEEAEQSIGDLLELLATAENASLDMKTTDDALQITLEIDYVAE